MIGYQHHWYNGERVDIPVGKVVCVGRNYAEHAKELNNPVPSEPLLFMKPSTAITTLEQPVSIQGRRGDVHYETEITLLIGNTLSSATKAQSIKAIAGVGLGLDLTLRELQNTLKEKGHPWELAKAFDGSCPLSGFVPAAEVRDWNNLGLQLLINGELRQDGNSSQMLTDIPTLVSYISHHFTLQPGDVVMTGTPKGVGQLSQNMELTVSLPDILTVNTVVV